MKVSKVLSVGNQNFTSKAKEEKQQKTPEQIKDGKKKLALALGAVGAIATAGITIYKNKTSPESIIKNAQKKIDSIMQESKLLSDEISKVRDEAYKMLAKAREALGLDFVNPDVSIKKLCSEATLEGAKIKIGDSEFISKKLDDGTERTIVTIVNDGISVLIDKSGLIDTVKSGNNKLYISNGEEYLFCKDYSSKNGVKKAAVIFDIYSPVYTTVYKNVETLKNQSIRHYGSTKFSKYYHIDGNDNRSLYQYWENFNPKNLDKSFKNSLILSPDGKSKTFTNLFSDEISFDENNTVKSFAHNGLDYIFKDGKWVKP